LRFGANHDDFHRPFGLLAASSRDQRQREQQWD
jgi:hypothetical protein